MPYSGTSFGLAIHENFRGEKLYTHLALLMVSVLLCFCMLSICLLESKDLVSSFLNLFICGFFGFSFGILFIDCAVTRLSPSLDVAVSSFEWYSRFVCFQKCLRSERSNCLGSALKSLV